jgi:hypothetical protein
MAEEWARNDPPLSPAQLSRLAVLLRTDPPVDATTQQRPAAA